MDFDNTMDYYFSDDESSNNSLYYSDDDDNDDDDDDDENYQNDPFQTPLHSVFNLNHNLSADLDQESPDQNSRPYCTFYFPNPSFPESDELNNKTHNKHRIIHPSIIDDIRINFRNLMMELQEGELTIPPTEEINVSRKRSLSLDIEHVNDCIHNGSIQMPEISE